jgi:hypothetical protein
MCRGLRLQNPAVGDHNGALAGASDSEAQRWLEWPAESLVSAGRREQLLGVRPGAGLLVPSRLEPGLVRLVAIDPASPPFTPARTPATPRASAR